MWHLFVEVKLFSLIDFIYVSLIFPMNLESMVDNEIYKRAIGYPYPRPDESFVFHRDTGEVETASSIAIREAWESSRTAVLAIGSNAAPVQLARKFPPDNTLAECERAVPVIAVTVLDWDVVYGAFIARYGSIPATMVRSEGTEAHMFITFLTENQLVTMNSTESAYYYVQMSNPTISVKGLESTLPFRPIFAYIAKAGAMIGEDNNPHALKEINANNRKYPSFSQTEQQHLLFGGMQKLTNGADSKSFKADANLAAFVVNNVQKPSRQTVISSVLRLTASDPDKDLHYTMLVETL